MDWIGMCCFPCKGLTSHTPIPPYFYYIIIQGSQGIRQWTLNHSPMMIKKIITIVDSV